MQQRCTSYKDVVPIAGVIGDYGAIVVAKNSPYNSWKDVVDAYKKILSQ